MDGDHRDRLLALHRADHLRDAGAGGPIARRADEGHRDEVAFLGFSGRVGVEDHHALLAVDGLDLFPLGEVAHDAQNGDLLLFEKLDDARLEDTGLAVSRNEAGEHAVADAGCRSAPVARRGDVDGGRRAALGVGPFGGTREEFAVGVTAGQFQNGDGGQVLGALQPLAAAFDQALIGQLLEHGLERNARRAGDAEGAGDLAFPRFARMICDEGEELFAGGKSGPFGLFPVWCLVSCLGQLGVLMERFRRSPARSLWRRASAWPSPRFWVSPPPSSWRWFSFSPQPASCRPWRR